MSIAATLARHVAQARYDALPASVVQAVKVSILDTLAVALGGNGAPGTSQGLRVVRSEGSTGRSTIWATGERVAPRLAAFANSLHAAALDYDSLHTGAGVHADIVSVPACVAMAQAVSASGKDLITAVAASNDVLCRLALATKANTGWFYSAVYGVIATAAVTARLLGADAARVGHAMGLAFANASGTYQPIVERSLAKRALGAFASGSGVFCGQLAAEGFTGPTAIVEGDAGLLRLYGPGDAEVITAGLGDRYESEHISLKPYPSCQCNHAALDAMLGLIAEHRVMAGEVTQIDAYVSPYMKRLVGAPFAPREDPQVEAQFSLQYSLACALLRGRLTIAEIRDDAVLDPRILPLAKKVHVIVDDGNQEKYAPARVVLRMRDGRVLTRSTTQLRGSATAPLSESELRAKLHDCLEAGGYCPSGSAWDEIAERVMTMQECADVNQFFERVGAILVQAQS